MYSCNLFFPQVKEFDEKILRHHINRTAINIDYSSLLNGNIKSVVRWIIGFGDENIDRCFWEGGGRDQEYDAVYIKEDIISNFFEQIQKLESREKECDIKIADYIK